jgi:multiple sugar transport system substrate-binding protein
VVLGRPVAAVALACSIAACGGGAPRDPAEAPLVLRHQPLGPDPEPLRRLVAGFERANPGLRVELQAIPNAADLAHQLLANALGARSADLDAFVVDVAWVAEFARAGWLADLGEAFPPARIAEEFLPGPAAAVVVDGRTRAVPWFADVGLLYWRTDLAPRAPRTFAELEAFARAAAARAPGVAGYVWQGRQYEGLACNFFEALWGAGGAAQDGERLVLDTPAARDALGWLRGLVERGVSPAWVAAAAEEDARRAFGEGRAAFMRNWPYAFALLEAEGSPVRGRVAVAPLPTAGGEPGAGALGGWQLAVPAFAPPARRAAAARLVAHLTSAEANAVLALSYGRSPARRGAYADPRVLRGAPFLAGLLPLLERARPRPLTPWYVLAADGLQGELSAAVTGLRPPAEALRRAQRHADRLAGIGR